jgi:hypothetical protein
VFTFSVEMNPSATPPLLYDTNFTIYPTAVAWSAGNTVLTCTPGSASWRWVVAARADQPAVHPNQFQF